ncbi:uncharacterized protein LOC127703000 isoform X2 [Mytilus californianus]|uniref:uncharacterized protein LOC127703000 isoform X2 n=1 Tax=Mytilus californianus TaxID=6549 RepID=UPI0022451DA9|nr:uncharacterized protein LOC127703000 isoform X2 [Mytilus californianus]
MKRTCLCIFMFSSLCSLGNDFSKRVFLTGEITNINDKEVVKLKCQSSKAPILHLVEFLVDSITVDNVRLAEGKCYNSTRECNDMICMCSKDGRVFTWIYYPLDMLRAHIFGCQVRILDEKNNTVKTTANLQLIGSDFLIQHPKHENVVINSVEITNSDGNDSDATAIAAVVSSIVVCILAAVIVSLIIYCYRKRRNETNEPEREQPLISVAANYEQVRQKVVFLPGERSKSQNTRKSSPRKCKKVSGCSICEKRTTENANCSTLERDFSQTSHNEECFKCKGIRQKYTKMYDSNLSKELDIKSDQKCTVDRIVILGDNQLLIVDKENNSLKVLDEENKWHSINELKSKLIGVTSLYNNVVAAIFSNEDRILYLQILSDKIIYTGKEIELKTLGEPLNIAYNKDLFVVRVGLGQDGRFGILNTEGKNLHIIWNSEMRFGDFTENSVEVALSFSERCIFISLFDKNAVYCVNFKGDTLWDTHVSCPKGILYVSNTAFFREKNIILACQNPNFIYQIDSKSGKLTLLIDEKDGINVPKCIGYKETETKYLLYTDTNTGKIFEFSLTAKKHINVYINSNNKMD